MSGNEAQGPGGGAACPEEASLVAWVLGELSGEELAAVEAHVAGCVACRERASRVRRLLDRMRALEPEPLARDLADEVLARLPATRGVRRPVARALALAAAFLAAVAIGWICLRSARSPAPTTTGAREVAFALDWLARAQEDDGSWDPARWGGQAEYRVGLTGLALLAFTGAHETPTEGRHPETVRRAVRYLLSQQNTNGRFGPFFSSAPYNHGIATLALLETYGLTADGELRMPLGRALHFILARQDRRGGWGYLGPQVESNTSVTAWQLQALLLARRLGCPASEDSLEKGLSWVESVLDRKGQAGYRRAGDFPYGAESLTAMAAFCLLAGPSEAARGDEEERLVEALVRLASRSADGIDYYRHYFLTQALCAARRHGHTDDARLAGLIAELQEDLLARQLTDGPNAGSWDPTDRWGSAGGRMYATTLACLSLQADRREAPARPDMSATGRNSSE